MRIMNRSHVTRALLILGLCVASETLAAQRASPAPGASQDPAPAVAVLAGSEIAVVESGGITGRIHSARFVAADGRITVEYRAPEVRAAAAPFTGTIEPDRYLALWRQLEAARIWNMRSAAPTRGADLMQVEVRLRLGDSAHSVRWDEANEQTKEVRELGEIVRRALALGREATFSR